MTEEHLREAYEQGRKEAEKGGYANPQFSSYEERIAFRLGWLDFKKEKLK